MTSPPRLRIVAALLVAAALTGCALSGGPRNPFQGGPDGERTISVEARNDNFADATVYVFRGGERIRAGVVTGKDQRTFRIAWTVHRSFQAEIDLLGGGRCLTRELQVAPGDRVQIVVPIDITNDPECRPR